MSFSSTQKAYIAGFLDGDGSIYVQAKPNPTYRYGFQIAAYIVFFQSQAENKFQDICSLIGVGYLRNRNDGIQEYIIGKETNIRNLLKSIRPFLRLKTKQADLMIQILEAKKKIKNNNDFQALLKLIDHFRELNYSKKRKYRTLTP